MFFDMRRKELFFSQAVGKTVMRCFARLRRVEANQSLFSGILVLNGRTR